MDRKVATAALLVASLLVSCGSGGGNATSVPGISTTGTGCPAEPTVTTTVLSSAGPTSPSTTSTTSTTAAAPDPATPVVGRPIGPGHTGAAVADAQARLLELGFWLIGASGAYDDSTLHAVTAFEKLHGLERDGALSMADLDVLATLERPRPRTDDGRVIEIDIEHQVILIVDDGRVEWIFDTSTGAAAGTTPTGWFDIYREIDGIRISHLGELYRPKYVVGGVAMHGYPEVPAQPASHGCIRVTNDAMDLIWTLDLAPLGTPVFVYDS